MESMVLIVHFFLALAIIGLILLQQGKGAEMGASFGSGGANTVFGSAGGFSFFAKLTAILSTLFFISSFALAILARDNATVGVSADLPFLQQSAPGSVQPPLNEVPEDVVAPSGDVPVE